MSSRPRPDRAYAAVAEAVREVRLSAGLTQADLAALLKRPQSYVSKVESGDRRLDLIELRAWAFACGDSLVGAAKRLEELLEEAEA